MYKVSYLWILAVSITLAISNVNADSSTMTQAAAQAMAISNYEKLAAPPNISLSSNQWLIYFGPQVADSVTARAFIQYVQMQSPIKNIPSQFSAILSPFISAMPSAQVVARSVTWVTLPVQQVTLSRSKGTGTTSNSK